MALRHLRLATAVVFAMASAGAASAAVITFDNGPISGTSYTRAGVTFTPVGGGSFFTFLGPNGTMGLLAGDDTSTYFPIRADIAGGTSSVSVDLGDFDADADDLFLQIYNSSNTLLDEVDVPVDAAFSGMTTLSLASPDIAYAIFGTFSPPSLQGSSVYTDNFTFTSVTGVPEPATLALFGAGVAGLGAMRRRKKTT